MAPKSSKASFTREFKFKAIHYYFGNGKNVIQASNNFKVDKNSMKSEELIMKLKRTLQSTRHGTVMFLIMEKELYKRFIDARKKESGSRDGGLIHKQNES